MKVSPGGSFGGSKRASELAREGGTKQVRESERARESEGDQDRLTLTLRISTHYTLTGAASFCFGLGKF